MDKLIIRQADEAEYPQILAIQTAVFCGEQDIPEEIIGSFLSNGPTCWVAERDGRIVGSIAAWTENGETHIGRFAVIPELRGHGVGKALLKHAAQELFRGGTEILYAEARDSAARMVRAMGGRDTGEPFPFYRGNVTPLVLEKEAFDPEKSTL